MADKVWIYYEQKKKLMQVERSRLKEGPYAPANELCFYPRSGSDKWHYVVWGETREYCVAMVNKPVYERIDKLKQQIAELERQLIK
jgi:hypothetical protein